MPKGVIYGEGKPTVKDHIRNAYEALQNQFKKGNENRQAYEIQQRKNMGQQIERVRQEAKLARAEADVAKYRGHYQPTKLDTIFRQDHPLMGARVNTPWWMEK